MCDVVDIGPTVICAPFALRFLTRSHPSSFDWPGFPLTAAAILLRTTAFLLRRCGFRSWALGRAFRSALSHSGPQSRLEIPLSCSALQIHGGSFLPDPQVFPAARNWIKCHLLGNGQWCTERWVRNFRLSNSSHWQTCFKIFEIAIQKKNSTRRCDTFTQANRTQSQFQGNSKKSAINFSKFGVPRPSKCEQVSNILYSTTTQTYLTCDRVPTNLTKENNSTLGWLPNL